MSNVNLLEIILNSYFKNYPFFNTEPIGNTLYIFGGPYTVRLPYNIFLMAIRIETIYFK